MTAGFSQRNAHNFMRFLFYFWSFAEIANRLSDPVCDVSFTATNRGKNCATGMNYNTRPLENVQFCSSSRKAKILNVGIH